MIATDNDEATGYEEFRIELLANPSTPGFTLRANGPLGETVPFGYQPPVSSLEIEEVFAGLSRATAQVTRGALRDNADEVRALGERLFNSICENRIANLYNHAFGVAWESGRNLRLRLVLNHPELAALPWEFLFDPSRRDFVTLSTRSPFVRHWQSPTAAVTAPPSVESPLRVLVAAAEVHQLDYGAEEEIALLNQLGSGQNADLKLVECIPHATPDQLFGALKQTDYHILHLILSGATVDAVEAWTFGTSGSANLPPAESLYLWADPEKGESGTRTIEISTLLAAVRRQTELQLVFLSGDCTDWIACQLTNVSPATIGWRGINTYQAYLSFTEGFYQALVGGASIDVAVTHGRKAIDAKYPGGKEWGMPVFYMQSPQGFVVRQKKKATVDDKSAISRSGKHTTKQPSDLTAQREWKKMQVLLSVAEQNYSALKAEEGKYKEGVVPDYVRTQLGELKSRISEIKAKLKSLAL